MEAKAAHLKVATNESKEQLEALAREKASLEEKKQGLIVIKKQKEEAALVEKAQLHEILKKIDKLQVKKLNEILTKHSPSTLIAALESFVALLRNHTNATNVDVELYFQDYTKLVLKLQRVDPTQMDVSIIDLHEKTLNELSPFFTDASHADHKYNVHFAPFIEWGKKFCEYSRYALEAQVVKDEFNQVEGRIESITQNCTFINEFITTFKTTGMDVFYEN